jgi:subtilisin family serine protease
MTPNKRKCSLPPFKIKPCLNVLDCGQRIGWNITAFNLPEAWEESKGEGINVAILDTGCDLYHEDLKNNILPGYNFIVPGSLPIDKAKHGTHCAGIICAEDNDIGIIGVAPKAKIIPVKILDDEGNGDMLDVCKGILWAADNGADIISMSLGCPEPVDDVRIAIQTVTARGIPVFCAAGNANLKKLYYPAGYPETVSIAAVDRNFKKAEFSNVAENLDFFAPGKDILSTIPGNKYGIMSGTSMACPWAAGVAALLLGYVRNHQKCHKTNMKLETIDDWKNTLRKYTTPVHDDSFKGFGIIDPGKFSEWVKHPEILNL